MKILQIIDSLPIGGGARFVVNLCKLLKQKGQDVELLLVDGKRTAFFDELEAAAIPIHILGEQVATRYNPVFSWKMSKLFRHYDVVHVHIFPTSYLVALASLFAKKCPPIVFTEHNSFNRRAIHPLFKIIEKGVYRRFKHIVCLSDQVRNFITKNLHPPQDKLSIIVNAIDIAAITNTTAYSKEELGYKDSDFLLLMSARLTTQKNHKVLIEAMALLPNHIKLLLAGEGVLLPSLEHLVQELKLQDRVAFLGPRNDIFRMMKGVDVNVLASNFEGLSLAALEAMSSQKPFIASKVEGLDFVVDNEALLFQNNSNELATLINKLASDKEFYDYSAAYCFHQSKHFDIDVMVTKYINLYDTVLVE